MTKKTVHGESIDAALKEIFPNGHPDFIPMVLAEIALHSTKNHDYAHGGKPTGNFDRVAAILAMYPGLELGSAPVVAIVYLLKQLDAALWLKNQGHVAQVEGEAERWKDISVYAKLISILNNNV